MIPRLFYLAPSLKGVEEVKVGGILSFALAAGDRKVAVERYATGFVGLLLQREDTGELILAKMGDKVRLVKGHREYCQWHSGGLAEKDDPLLRRYCTNAPETAAGFCKRHANTLRAVYAMCFTATGRGGLEHCLELDRALGPAARYAVYITSVGQHLKVGSTRAWRAVERVGEQPHDVAAVVLETTSAFEARSLEVRISGLAGFSEHSPHKAPHARADLPSSLGNLFAGLKKVEKHLSLAVGNPRVFRVDPDEWLAVDRITFARARELEGRALELAGFYQGSAVFADPASGKLYAVKAGELLNRDSVEVA